MGHLVETSEAEFVHSEGCLWSLKNVQEPAPDVDPARSLALQ
jgi:hypothetical protein